MPLGYHTMPIGIEGLGVSGQVALGIRLKVTIVSVFNIFSEMANLAKALNIDQVQ